MEGKLVWKGQELEGKFLFYLHFLELPEPIRHTQKDGTTSCIWVDGPADLKFAVFV